MKLDLDANLVPKKDTHFVYRFPLVGFACAIGVFDIERVWPTQKIRMSLKCYGVKLPKGTELVVQVNGVPFMKLAVNGPFVNQDQFVETVESLPFTPLVGNIVDVMYENVPVFSGTLKQD